MSVIGADTLLCRICYRCVRSCPVKAIRVQADRVQVVEERCIDCASCVTACPQGAMSVRDDVPVVWDAISMGRRVVASVDPSAPAYFPLDSFEQMRSVLRSLGFSDAVEAASGAEMIGVELERLLLEGSRPKPMIITSCPAIALLVQKYHQHLIPHLAPIVSPMIAHGRSLKTTSSLDTFVVYVGPCVAKKVEITGNSVAGAVDAVLTFTELSTWLADKGIDFPPAPVQDSPDTVSVSARLSFLEGGLSRVTGLRPDAFGAEVLATSGIESCLHLLDSLKGDGLGADLVELMLCSGGCVSGPAMRLHGSPFANRQRVLAYARHSPPISVPPRSQWPPLVREYSDRTFVDLPVSETQIRDVLHRMDKFTPADELNCGACGYPTCREKAVATVRGMAEVRMCIPHMRSRAESLANVVMELTPNLVIVVDSNLHIVSLSPSAERALDCSLNAVRHRPLRTILSPIDDFERVLRFKSPVVDSKVRYGPELVVEQTIVPALVENMLVCIMRDITIDERRREELSHLAQETIARSQEVIDRQMRVAHQIASLLGETTAESKIQLSRLIELVEGLGDVSP